MEGGNAEWFIHTVSLAASHLHLQIRLNFQLHPTEPVDILAFFAGWKYWVNSVWIKIL
jgi:hypothetical protein